MVLTELLLGVLAVGTLFRGMAHYANPQLENATRANPVIVLTDPSTCGFQIDPIGKRANHSDCDKAKALLSKMGVPYAIQRLPEVAALEMCSGAN